MGLIGKIALIGVVSTAVLIAVIWDVQNENRREGRVTTNGDDIKKSLPPHITTEETPHPETPHEPAPSAAEQPREAAQPPESGTGAQAQPSQAEPEPATAGPPAEQPKESPEKPVPEPPRPVTKYIIQKGDTLSEVAKEFYGDANLWRAIAAANPGIEDPNKLKVGAEIVIPPSEEVVEVEPWPAIPDSTETYIVQRGDTLTSIARTHYDGDASKAELIYRANKDKITNKNFLKPGTILVIPEVKEQEM